MIDKIESDLKAAMLAGDKMTVETLKTIKTAIQYDAVSKSVKPADLNEEQIQAVVAREAKKRQEAADLYDKAGETERSNKELAEKKIIDKYLPEQMDETELAAIVKEEVSKLGNPEVKDMGRIIGAVRVRTGGSADGAKIAALVKQSLEQG